MVRRRPQGPPGRLSPILLGLLLAHWVLPARAWGFQGWDIGGSESASASATGAAAKAGGSGDGGEGEQIEDTGEGVGIQDPLVSSSPQSAWDAELGAMVYTRAGLEAGRGPRGWRPHASAVGFHLDKFLGGTPLPPEMQALVAGSVLDTPAPVLRPPLRLAINFAANCCREAQEANCLSTIQHSADVCIAYQWESLGKDFVTRNRQVLESKRGAGYWIWKPYLIFHTLLKVQDGDVVLYSEFAASFKQDLGPVFQLPERTAQDVVFFSHPRGEESGPRVWSKGDVLVLLNCYNNTCTEEARHVTAAFSLWKKSEEAVLLASYWMSYMEDPRICTDMEDTLGFPNMLFRPGEAQEAAVAGLIAYKWNLQPIKKESIQDVASINF